MLERISTIPGHRLDQAGYLAEFGPNFAQTNGLFYKLERMQEFQEPGVPSWEALADGDWDHAMRLVEDMRGPIREENARAAGFERRRVRVVEHPISLYLQWEMQVLRLRALYGDRIRVLPVSAVEHLEVAGLLPELVMFDDLLAYEVCYVSGAPAGARRIVDREVIMACRWEFDELFAAGEDIERFFAREIAPLPPPALHRSG